MTCLGIRRVEHRRFSVDSLYRLLNNYSKLTSNCQRQVKYFHTVNVKESLSEGICFLQLKLMLLLVKFAVQIIKFCVFVNYLIIYHHGKYPYKHIHNLSGAVQLLLCSNDFHLHFCLGSTIKIT